MEDAGLFFWLIVAAIAVLQGIGQKKKKPGQGGRMPPGQRPPGVPRGDSGETLEIDSETARPDTTRVPRAGGSGPGGPSGKGEESSEGVIPADVWAEILGLARGQPQKGDPVGSGGSGTMSKRGPEDDAVMDEIEAGTARPSREPRRRPETVRRERPKPAPEKVPPERAVPASHTASGRHHITAPSDYESRLGISAERKAVAKVEAGVPAAEPEAETVTPATKLFGTGSKDELRKAIILKEVLGPPVGMRRE